MYNIFRLLGDFTHLVTIIGLLGYIWRKKTSAGISGKTQFLFALVFTARYLDLFASFYSVYNSVLKVIYMATTYVTALSIYFKFKDPYRPEYDTFRCEILAIGAFFLAVFYNYSLDVNEVMWAFSEYLEAVAIIPQIYFVSKAGYSENVVDYYIYGLAQYRLFYVVNWAYRYYNEYHLDLISTVPGVVQCMIYFYYFCTMFNSKKMDMYRACDVSDPSNQPVYIISANDLPPKENKDPVEKV